MPLYVLAAGAALAGFVGASYFIGHHYKEFWGASLFELPGKDILHHMHDVPDIVIWSPTIAMLSGFAFAYLYYILVPWLPAATAQAFRPLYLFLLNKWYFDELYDWLFVRPANRHRPRILERGRRSRYRWHD